MKDGRDNETVERRHKIRFTNRVQFKNIRHVSEFSEDEIKNGWYNKDDFNQMSDDVSEISKLLEKGVTRRDGEDLCIRGLEHIVEEDLANFRAEKMINSIDAVLDEQEEQWDKGEDEPELIAKIYAEYAKTLAKEAYAIGLRDAEEGYKSFDLSVTSKEHNTREQNEEEIFIDGSSSLLSLPSLSSSSSSRSFQHKGSSSIDSSIHSITIEGETIEIEKDLPSEAKVNKNKLILKKVLNPKQKIQTKRYTKEDNKNEKKKSSQRKIQPRRSLQDRKNGSELSPFIFRRDGTIMFRKPEVEKLKREQSVKRRNCIHDSLSNFLDDDDDDDYLAGVLSSKSKKSSVLSR